jgi:hypothetical protein
MRLALVTPTWVGDLDKFTFLRESLVRCEITIPHFAVVHTEDLAVFKELPFRDGLTVLPTAEVLPGDLERRRRANSSPKGWPAPFRSLQSRLRRSVDGRWTQQVAKLASAKVVGAESVVCVDSDVFFVRNVSESDFFDLDGRLHLHEPEGMPFLLLGWLSDSARFLKLPLSEPVLKMSAYQSQVVPLHGGVIADMQKYTERTTGNTWFDAMFDAGVVEYTTYGLFARYIDNLARVSPIWSNLCINFHSPEQYAVFPEYFPRRVDEVDARAGMVHGELGVPVGHYRNVVEQLWTAPKPPSQTP